MVVGQRVVAGETMIMLAEVSTVSDDKTCGDDDASVAEAESLAVEALRLAEEAKKAAQRLAEVRATLKFLKQLNSPKQEPLTVDSTSIVEEKKEAEAMDELRVETVVSQEIEAPKDEASADAATPLFADVVTPTTAPVSSPTNSILTPTSPVSILKSSASKSGPKEVRYAPDTVDPALSPSRKGQLALTETQSEDDIIVKLYDAVGIDKICGLDFGSEEKGSALAKKKAIAPKLVKKVDPFAGTTFLVEDSSKDEEEQKKEESTAAVTIQAKSEPEEEPDAPHDELVPVVAASATEVELDAEVAPVASPTEMVVVEESTEEQVAKVDPPSSTVEVAKAEESSLPVTTEAMEGEAATPVKAAEPSPLTVDTTTTTTASGSDESPRKMTPLMKKALARQRSPVLAKPDPFGGEHDDMDFIPCGNGDVAGVDDADEAMKQLSSPRMLCGWAV